MSRSQFPLVLHFTIHNGENENLRFNILQNFTLHRFADIFRNILHERSIERLF